MGKKTSDEQNSDTTPEYLIPRMGSDNVVEKVYYETLHITSVSEGEGNSSDIKEALDPFSLPDSAYSAKPAEGVLLSHEQIWQQKGLSLGSLVHSICLAPGEVTKIAMIDWRRRAGVNTSESIGEHERLENEAAQNRAVSEVQNAVAKETMRGESSSTSFSKTTEGGGGGSIFGIGASAGYAKTEAKARTVSMSVGDRSMAASANQKIHQRTLESSQAARSRRATIIKEVNEQESQQLTTRVVANYNHMHALTIQYYEVLQNFKLTNQISKAERVIFLPMKVIVFDATTMKTHLETLIEIADDHNMHDLRLVLLRQTSKAKDNIDAEIKLLEEEVKLAEKNSDDLKQQLLQSLNQLQDISNTLRPSIHSVFASAKTDKKHEWKVNLDILYYSALNIPSLKAQAQSKLPSEKHNLVLLDNQYQEITSVVNQVQSFAQNSGVLGYTAETLKKIDSPFVKLHSYATELLDKKEKLKITNASTDITEARLLNVLNREQLFFNQQIWIRMDVNRVHSLLRNKEHKGERLFGRVDPTALGVFGNYVAYRWPLQSPADDSSDTSASSNSQGKNERQQKEHAFYKSLGLELGIDTTKKPETGTNYPGTNYFEATKHEAEVALSSDGLFAEAVLGQSNSAEKIDLSRFWKWQDSPIPILPPEINAVGSDSRASNIDATPGQLGQSIVKLFGSQAMPEPTNLTALVESLAKSDVFKDMSGKDAAAELAKILAKTSAAGASHGADNALAAYQAMLKTASDLAGASDASILGGLLNVNPELLNVKAAKPEKT